MFLKVSSREEMVIVAALARKIWRSHFVPIVGEAQVEYMLDRFQSEESIAIQIAHQGFRYYLISSSTSPIGYFAVQARSTELFLSKLYVEETSRKNGVGRRVIDFLEELARKEACTTISLTVNRNNTVAIAFYERVGFEQMASIRTDIGSGFVMDDYVYQRVVESKARAAISR